jgi:hypothetical protein
VRIVGVRFGLDLRVIACPARGGGLLVAAHRASRVIVRGELSCVVILRHRSASVQRSSGSSALADILVQCPRTGAPVSTGLKTEWVLLKSLPCVAVPLRCPACGQMHKWKPDDAWIGSAHQSGDGDFVPASRTPLAMASSSDTAKLPDCD